MRRCAPTGQTPALQLRQAILRCRQRSTPLAPRLRASNTLPGGTLLGPSFTARYQRESSRSAQAANTDASKPKQADQSGDIAATKRRPSLAQLLICFKEHDSSKKTRQRRQSPHATVNSTSQRIATHKDTSPITPQHLPASSPSASRPYTVVDHLYVSCACFFEEFGGRQRLRKARKMRGCERDAQNTREPRRSTSTSERNEE